jgi:UDP-N-acetyl-D-galactosamine dehydrogenase
LSKAPHHPSIAVIGPTPVDGTNRPNLVIAAVRHADYLHLDDDRLAGLVAPAGILADIKGMWRGRGLGARLDYWTL